MFEYQFSERIAHKVKVFRVTRRQTHGQKSTIQIILKIRSKKWPNNETLST